MTEYKHELFNRITLADRRNPFKKNSTAGRIFRSLRRYLEGDGDHTYMGCLAHSMATRTFIEVLTRMRVLEQERMPMVHPIRKATKPRIQRAKDSHKKEEKPNGKPDKKKRKEKP